MPSRWIARVVASTASVWMVTSTLAFADPPARVARISFSTGAVSFRPASVDEWSTASLNYPLTIGDHVWTDTRARTELQLDTAVLRVAPATELSVLNLDDHVAQIRLTQGTVSVRVRAVDVGDTMEIDTPAGAVSLLEPGLYRLDVNDAGDATVITVRQGEADMANGTTDVMVHKSQSVTISLDSSQPDVQPAIHLDDFEDWALARDRRSANVETARYVSAATIGYEDLDANGAWQTVPEYGAVWVPRVRGEWAPYRFGRWAWVEPWGWTWIDDEPWGFAPFHYGRWAFVQTRGWVWVPGAVVARPVYAPALVAFVGGPNWSVSVRSGAPIGWFPLGPREVYVPSYRTTPVYVQRINAAHVTNVNVTRVTYVNRSVPGAVTAVSRETFVRSQPVERATVAVTREQVQSAKVISGTEIAPERVSVTGTAAARVQPPAPAVSRQVMVRTAPPGAESAGSRRRFPRDTTAAPARRASAPSFRRARRSADASPRRAVRHRRAPPRSTFSRHHHCTTNAASTRSASQSPGGASASRGAPIKPAAPPANAQLNQRFAQERADIQSRHAQERSALQARHQQERQQLRDPHKRAELQQRQQQETKALNEKQRQEREAMVKRQQEERKARARAALERRTIARRLTTPRRRAPPRAPASRPSSRNRSAAPSAAACV